MRFPNAYIQYLIHFHGDRDYFECHEILEDYWKQEDPGNRQSIWVGFIQLAVAQYHYRRGNEIGAKKLLVKSVDILKLRKAELKKLGIDGKKLFIILNDLQTTYLNGKSYQNINLPITNQQLLNICRKECFSAGFQWCSDAVLHNDFIVHRHQHRDQLNNEFDRSLNKRINIQK